MMAMAAPRKKELSTPSNPHADDLIAVTSPIGNSADATFVDCLIERAQQTPHQVAYTFLQEGDAPNISLTYAQLFQQAAGFAALLQQRGLEGKRILLIFKFSPYFIISFFACLMAGAIAVPVSPPRRHHAGRRLKLLAQQTHARALIPEGDEVRQAVVGLGEDDVYWFDLDQLSQTEQLAAYAHQWKKPPLTGQSIACVQYTSGATGNPKGVMVTHKNLIANSAIIQEAFGHSRASIGLSALPLLHDMGLIGGVLQPLFVGFPVYLMNPTQLIQRPQRWLQLISEYRVTTSGGPNFIYDFALRAIQDEHMQGVDLSQWRVAFCGAEPIHATTIQHFVDRFQAYGFRDTAFFPCYGMAEATLYITGNALDRPPLFDMQNHLQTSLPIVSCGTARHNTRIEIVDPESFNLLPQGQAGEIWVSGDSVASGYWKRADLTEAVFNARLAGSNEGPFLRTGDVGYLRNGELHVVGRLNDLIVFNGAVYVPHDLENLAEYSHPGLRLGCCAAFTIIEGKMQRLILALELKRELLRQPTQWSEVATAVRSAISHAYQLQITDVVLLKTGTLPKTASGKIKRAQCRSDYLSGRLVRVTDLVVLSTHSIAK